MIKKALFLIISLFLSNSFNQEYTFVDKEINIFKNVEVKEKNTKVFGTYHGYITAYGPDCTGCSGITASGYNVRNTIYYHDKEYGKIRIVAADKSLPFGSIVRISNLNISKEPIIAIVLDRGSAIGFNRKAYFDLLYPNERSSNLFGRQKGIFEILRKGY